MNFKSPILRTIGALSADSGRMRSYCKSGTARQQRIPILPEKVDRSFLADYVRKDSLQIPIGVETNSLKIYYYPFGHSYINMILSNGMEAVRFIDELTVLMADKGGLDVTVIDAGHGCQTKNHQGYVYYSTPGECETIISSMFDMVVYRNNTYKDAIEKGETIERFDQKVFIIYSITALKNVLSDEGVQKLELILEKGRIDYNITFLLVDNPIISPVISPFRNGINNILSVQRYLGW